MGYLGTAAGALLAGCGQPGQAPWRELSFRDMQVEETGDGWRITFELVKLAQAPDDLSTFHDVRVHAYNQNQTEICSEEIGTIAESYPGGNGLPIEMNCSVFPTMLTYGADESPCDEEVRTVISIAVYDEENGWSLERHARECNEGLPPNPRE